MGDWLRGSRCWGNEGLQGRDVHYRGQPVQIMLALIHLEVLPKLWGGNTEPLADVSLLHKPVSKD
jgi:hypothetical protein